MNIKKEYYEYLVKKIDEILKKELPLLKVETYLPTYMYAASTECNLSAIDNPNTINMLAGQLIDQITNHMVEKGVVALYEFDVFLDPTMLEFGKFAVYTFADFAKPKSRVDIVTPGWVVLDNRDILKGAF